MPRWGSELPMVGRSAELARLTRALAAARRAEPGAVLLAGDAGVGKTRLLVELAARARAAGMRMVAGHCVDFGDAGLPYLAFTEILRTLATDDPRLAEQHPVLAALLGEAGAAAAPAGQQLHLFDGVVAALTAAAGSAGLLVVVEDLHWADQSTRDLLRYLVTRLGGQRLLVVASYRTDDLHRRHPLRPLLAELARHPRVERLPVDGLPDPDVAALVRGLSAELDEDDTDLGIDRIVARADGNAFYAEQLLQAAHDGDAASLPAALADVLLARLEQLPGAAHRVVRMAAVAGRQVRHERLSAVTELPDAELEQALREAVARNVLVASTDGSYTFRHALLREAAYADLLPGERVRVHARLAGLLADGGGPAAELAYHRRESHDLPGALVASLAAAEDARRVGAPAEQLQHLDVVLRLWPAVPDAAARTGRDEVGVVLAAAAAAAGSGEPARAVALSRQALGMIDAPADAELAARVRSALAQNLMHLDADKAAYAESSAALDLLPAEPPTPASVWAAATHVRTAWYVGDLDGARRAGQRALAGAESLGLDAAWAEAALSLARMDAGVVADDDIIARLEAADARAGRAGDDVVQTRAAYNVALVRYDTGDLVGAQRWADLGAERSLAKGLGSSVYGAGLRFLRCLVRYVAGDWDGSRDAARVPVDAPAALRQIQAAGWLVAVGRGTAASAASTYFRSMAGDPLAVLTAGTSAVDEAVWQAPADALPLVGELVRRVEPIWGSEVMAFLRPVAHAVAAQADRAAEARLLGDATTAQALLAEARPWVERVRRTVDAKPGERRVPGVEAQAWTRRLSAEWARLRGDADPDLWSAAVDGFDYGHVYEQARSRWRWAEALVATDQRTAAAEQAAAAYDVAQRLGARPLADAVAGLVRRARLDAGLPGAAGRPASSPLTPREQDVLGLLARGMTNRQIGRELYISEKTASVHVSRIVAKLKASGRTEAVALAHRLGLLPG